MKPDSTTLAPALVVAFALLLAGCAGTPKDQRPEKGPHGTIAYYIDIEASEPGARIEAAGEYAGQTPLKLKVWGDKDGTFHNFGSPLYTIRVFPVKPGQQAQSKEYRTGGFFAPEDKIPQRLYFQF